VRVRDTGVGIAQEDLDVFDRFYRAEGGEGREGTGLGLSIVRGLLELHGCTIRAESEPGRGSAFTFTLPLARSTRGTPEGPNTNDPPPPEPDSSPRFRVLRPEDFS
jgi:signal transduction histidine kinase